MKIMLVAPRSITKHYLNHQAFRYDYAFWNFYLALLSLGHNTFFFDTSTFDSNEFDKKFELFKPDLIFCIMTNDRSVCPDEPWQSIEKITNKGTCKTFNWFCDDSWRFENFSSKFCNYFHFSSTTEIDMLKKYNEIGYSNIRYANWHSNNDVYSNVLCQKNNLLGFIGNLNEDRKKHLSYLINNQFNVANVPNASFEDMIHLYSSSVIGLNFTKSQADGKRQMKARIFEIPATRTLLLTENAPGIEDLFKIDEEIMTFENEKELLEKVKWVNNNLEKAMKIISCGYERYLKDHTSQIRLQTLIGSLK